MYDIECTPIIFFSSANLRDTKNMDNVNLLAHERMPGMEDERSSKEVKRSGPRLALGY
jgi:hypothetical protein